MSGLKAKLRSHGVGTVTSEEIQAALSRLMISILMKSYPDRLQKPWNESNKMTLKSNRDVLLACASALCARSIEQCAGSAIAIALLYFTDTILYLLKSLPVLT